MGIFQCHESWSANLLSKNGDFTSCHGSFLSGVKIFLTVESCQWPAGRGLVSGVPLGRLRGGVGVTQRERLWCTWAAWLFLGFSQGWCWSNYSDLTRVFTPNGGDCTGNPFISGKPRLVKYYNLARWCIWTCEKRAPKKKQNPLKSQGVVKDDHSKDSGRLWFEEVYMFEHFF